MTKTCDNCHLGASKEYLEKCWGGLVPCSDNPDHPHWEPITKADRVRNMSDRELAKLFADQGGTLESWLEWLETEDVNNE